VFTFFVIVLKNELRVLLDPWNRETIALCAIIDVMLWSVVVMYAVECGLVLWLVDGVE
jgi:hypothetical protein